jgi:PKD repeat protein
LGCLAQIPQTQFTLPSEVCQNQSIQLVNTSSGASRYEWDFNQGDLSKMPIGSELGTIGGSVTTGIDVVFDGENWFGFVASRETNSILRLSYGNDLKAKPTVIDLGNVSSVINRPIDIKIVFENGEWFGFVYGESTSLITRIDFGNSLDNTTSSSSPISAVLVSTGSSTGNGGFDIVRDGSQFFIVYTQFTSLGIIRLNTIRSIPASADIINTPSITGASSLGDVKIFRKEGFWYGYVVAFGTKTLHKLNFGTNIFSNPMGSNITGAVISGLSPYGIDGGIDNGNVYLFISTLEGVLVKVNLGPDLSLPPSSESAIGNLLVLGNTLKIRLVKDKTHWYAFAASWNSSQLFKITFPDPTSSSNLTFSEDSAPEYNYSSPGQYGVTLTAYNGSYQEETHKVIIVSNSIAPVIDFSYDNICVNSPITFDYQSADDIDSFLWNFGNGNTSESLMPEEKFSSSGTYSVSLTVTASNGCDNTARKQILIYEKPISGFDIPLALACTNNKFTFVSNEDSNFDGNLSYEWYVNNDLISTERDLKHAFSNIGDQTIKLITSIPGCSDETTQIIEDVKEGPIVAFTHEGNCEGETIDFINQSSGEIEEYHWDIGGVGQFEELNPSLTFDDGTYTVVLNTIGTNGCISTTAEDIVINAKPQVNFTTANDLLCSGSGINFQDVTVEPIDSPLASWAWSFGDEKVSDVQNPIHLFEVAGNYAVYLKISTASGCDGEFEKLISVKPSPDSTFTFTTACRNTPVQFTGPAQTGITSWQWQIGDKSYTTRSPSHTFRSPGTTDVILTTKSTNGCEGRFSKEVTVPVPLVAAFDVNKNCVDEVAQFVDLTTGEDPVVKREWKLNDNINLLGNPVEYTFGETGEKNVELTVTAESGCTYIVRDVISVTLSPKASFTATPEIGTPPSEIKFTNTSLNATGYEWTFGDGVTSEEIAPLHVYTVEGIFTAQLLAFNEQGCEDVATKTITLSTPKPNVTLKAITTTDNSDGTMKVMITIENEGNTVLANLPVDVDVSGKLNLREIIKGPILPLSRYNLVLTYGLDKSGINFLCAETALANDLNTEANKLCIELQNSLVFFPGYPNPVTESLNVEWVTSGDQKVLISMFNSQGLRVFKLEADSKKGLNRHVFPLQNLQNGIYHLVLESGSEKTSQRILIAR